MPSTYSGLSPSGDGGSGGSNGGRSQRDGLGAGVQGDGSGSLDGRDVVGQVVGVVVGVVADGAGGVAHSVSAGVGSNDDAGVGGGASNGAVGGRHSPAGVVDPASAEVGVGAGAERDLVGELARRSNASSDDTSLPVLEDLRGEDGGRHGHRGQGQEADHNTELVHFGERCVSLPSGEAFLYTR